MKELLLDTPVWFRYLVGSEHLMPSLHWKIDNARDSLWISSISIWELGMMQRAGRIRLDAEYRDWVRRAMELLPVRVAPVDADVVRTSLEMDMHDDPIDRFIAATAVVHGLSLVTVDPQLASLKGLGAIAS